ncbi:pyocin knob domain-containing protein [Achromobacter aegrifaciens]
MQASNAPIKSAVPFAESGTKNTIPVASQIGVTPGAASFADGFPPLTMTPLAAGGVPPYGADFNGILNFLSTAIRWSQAGANYRFDAAFSAAVGGYPKGAILAASSGTGSRWLNLMEDNTADPDAGGGGWVALGAGLATNEEVQAGISAVKVVTPAALQSKIQSSQTDTTAGRLLTVGSFGLGFDAFLDKDQDLDYVLRSGFYGQNVAAYAKIGLHYPAESAAGTLLVQSSGQINTQVFTTFYTTDQFVRTRNEAGVWSRWKRVIFESDIATFDKAGIVRMATIAEAAELLHNGVSLSPATLVSAFLGGGNSSIAANGYQRLPSGLVIQQMVAPATVNSSVTATFPVAFPNACFKVFVSESNSVEWFTDNIVVYGSYGRTKTGVGITAYRWNGSSFTVANGALANVLAIGY